MPTVTLDEFRERSRDYGDSLDRLDVFEEDITCSSCSDRLTERFSATMSGEFLCWECAMSHDAVTERDITHSTDPTKAVVGKSGLNEKSLCDYVINVATGCTHGCKFCYVPSTPNITTRQGMLAEHADVESGQRDWGSYLLYRDDLPERLRGVLNRKRTWKQTPRGRGVVMLSSGTDCYQDRRTGQITRGCVIELVRAGIPVRILTRSPSVVRDVDVFTAAVEKSESSDGDLVRVGSSIPCLDDDVVRAIEPGAPVPSARVRALRTLGEHGVPTYVSMSPTYPTQTRQDFETLFSTFSEIGVDLVFHEPINPRGGNFNMTIEAARDAGEDVLAEQLQRIKSDQEYWVSYSLKHMSWAEEFGEKYGVDVHTWPDARVIKNVDDELSRELRGQKSSVSPETFATPPFPASKTT